MTTIEQKLIDLCEEMIKTGCWVHTYTTTELKQRLATLRAEAEKEVNSEFDSIVAESRDLQLQIQKIDALITKNAEKTPKDARVHIRHHGADYIFTGEKGNGWVIADEDGK